MKEGEIEKLNIKKEEELGEAREEIEKIREEELKDKTKPGGPGYWAGIDPKHLREEKELEMYVLFNKNLLSGPEFNTRRREILDEIRGDKKIPEDKKNSIINFIDWFTEEKANPRYGKDQSTERQARE